MQIPSGGSGVEVKSVSEGSGADTQVRIRKVPVLQGLGEVPDGSCHVSLGHEEVSSCWG